MKDKDKWAERLNKKMEGYSESLPDGLWERLEMELPPPHQVVPMWRTRRFAIVAAAALIVMVSGLAVWLAGFWAEDTVYPDAAMARKEFSPFCQMCSLRLPRKRFLWSKPVLKLL